MRIAEIHSIIWKNSKAIAFLLPIELILVQEVSNHKLKWIPEMWYIRVKKREYFYSVPGFPSSKMLLNNSNWVIPPPPSVRNEQILFFFMYLGAFLLCLWKCQNVLRGEESSSRRFTSSQEEITELALSEHVQFFFFFQLSSLCCSRQRNSSFILYKFQRKLYSVSYFHILDILEVKEKYHLLFYFYIPLWALI